MTTTKHYEYLNRLTHISSTPSASSVVSFAYSYNNANQRIVSRLADGSYWRYQYDSLGEVTSGHKFFSDETPVPGQQFDYSFDTIGNRTQTTRGGDQNGAYQRTANYGANLLNQYTNRDVPGYLDVIGIGLATNTVTVNIQTAWRKGEYFRQELSTANGTTPVWEGVTVAENGQTSVTGSQFVPKTPEPFGYDYDGNLTSDGRWNYGWDAENRLVALTNNNASVGPQKVIRFEYDSKGRRIRKQVWGNNVGSGSPTNDVRFVYDGWNLIAELNALNSSTLLRSYVWGLDLSGSVQGAGGVGGLLEVVYYDSGTTNCFVTFDANGNVAALVNAADGTSTAQYEYGPFGEFIRATGLMGKANPIRFSTKYQDHETDFIYYGRRYLSTSIGGWLTRDPIAEKGGRNLYGFVGNDPGNKVDKRGLQIAVDLPVLHVSPGTPRGGECGAFSWSAIWVLDPGHSPADKSSGGLIVQYVQANFDVTDCKGTPLTLFGPTNPHAVNSGDWPFYEAWTIPPGAWRPSAQRDDFWQMPSFGSGTKGTITISGQADYYDGAGMPWYFQPGNAGPPSNLLPTSGTFVPPGVPTSGVARTLVATWNCCCDTTDRKTHLETSVNYTSF
jgi:RHS repeat-associated protein